MLIFVDCETIPDQKRGPDPSRVKAPSNYKDEAKIREYKLTHAQEEWEKTSCSRWRAQVVAIGVALEDGDPETFIGFDETDLIRQLAEWYDRVHPPVDRHPNEPDAIWCAHNGIGFDFPILALRAFRAGFSRLGKDILPTHPKFPGARHKDTYAAAGFEGRLDDLADFFGIPRVPGQVAGKDVWSAWQVGQYARIREHLHDDVVVLRQAALKMRDLGML